MVQGLGEIIDDYNTSEDLIKNANLLEESKTPNLLSNLHSDMFYHETINFRGVSMHLKLTRSIDLFVLLSNEDDATYCNK